MNKEKIGYIDPAKNPPKKLQGFDAMIKKMKNVYLNIIKNTKR